MISSQIIIDLLIMSVIYKLIIYYEDIFMSDFCISKIIEISSEFINNEFALEIMILIIVSY